VSSRVLLLSKAKEFGWMLQNFDVLFNWNILSVRSRSLLDRLYLLGRNFFNNTVSNILSSSVVEVAIDLYKRLSFIIRSTLITRRLSKNARRSFISNLMLSKLNFKSTLHFLSAVPMALSNCVAVFTAPQRLVPDLYRHHALF